jgi:hypothetical protein
MILLLFEIYFLILSKLFLVLAEGISFSLPSLNTPPNSNAHLHVRTMNSYALFGWIGENHPAGMGFL